MIRTTLFALSVLATLGFAPVAMAQEGDAPGAQPQQDGEGPGARPEGDRERRGRRGRRGGRGFGGDMQEQLGLSDDQVKKMDAIRQEMREAFRAMREGGGGFDRDAMREMREKMTSKMNEILTPEQQKKMEELRSRRGRRGEGMRGRGRRGGPNPARMREDAVKALNLGEEASAVVLPVLDKILAAQTEGREALRTQRQALQEKAAGDVTTDELTAQLAAFRKARKESQEKLATARAELQELLTLQQEAKLVALGILE